MIQPVRNKVCKVAIYTDSTLHGEFGLNSTLLKTRGIQRGFLERTEDMKDGEMVKAVKSNLRLKKGLFRHQIGPQPNKHLHEQLSKA